MKKNEKMDNIFVVKKDNTLEKFDIEKVIVAVNKSSQRALKTLSKDDMSFINDYVTEKILSIGDKIPIITMHSIVESCLDKIDPSIAKSYRDYRNYKTEFVEIMDEVFKRNQDIMYRGDKENANADSALVSTKRSLSFNVLNEQLYRKFFLNTEELQAQNDGYIYIHDKSARRDTMNCCLFNMAEVLDGGFEMSNMFYNEPKTLDTAFDVAGDIILAAAGQQYGGFTVPQVDQIMEKYAEKSYKIYYNEYISICKEVVTTSQRDLISPVLDEMADDYAVRKLERDFRQGFQGWEYKLNTVASCRGDYPFITITVGLGTSRLCKMATKAALRVHKEGQGKPGHKKPALFPKIVFLYDKNLHGKGCISEDLYHEAIDCSAKTMYPDWLSLTGKGYVAEMYKRYGKAISPMGCRAFLSPWYERGGMHPADENDVPVFIGRFNIGAVSLHLPMILAKSREEDRDFYEVLDYYLEMIRNLHLRTYDYLGKMRASVNPLAYCEGGFYGGHLKPTDRIEPLLKSATASFGITALNELQELYNGKSLVEDGQFALEVMKHINDKINQFKEEDGRLYAIYGTPAENLCFSGDTIVQAYPSNKCIKDIREGDLVYSFNESSNKIELKRVLGSKLTAKNSVVMKITFDTGQHVVCTPDHPFARRVMNKDKKGVFTGGDHIEYISARNLKVGDRLKSNYFDECTGYMKFTTDQKRCNVVYEYFNGAIPDKCLIHHKDKDKLNDTIENLELMSSYDHKVHHMEDTIRKYCYTSESQRGENNSFYGKRHTDEAKEKNRKAHIGKHPGNWVDPEKVLTLYNKGMSYEEISAQLNIKVDTVIGKLKQLDVDLNHKVVSIEYLSDLIDVYNIEVEDNHNYFVGGDQGILVHNCGVQIKQFRAKYGIIKGVSDKEYVSNSFHCHVTEDISPIEKQNLEYRFWNLLNGGKIQYVKYPISYNTKAIETLVDRAMDMGYYEGVNLALSYCDDCGYEALNLGEECPNCGSKNLTKIDRMNGYLAFSRVKGESRMNTAKMAEINERKSM